MVNHRSRDVGCAISERQQGSKSVALFGYVERSAFAKAHIEPLPSRADRFANRHIGTPTHAAEGRHLKPFRILIADDTHVSSLGIARNAMKSDVTRNRRHLRVGEWREE